MKYLSDFCIVSACIAMLFIFFRLFYGPSAYDRVLAVNSFSTLVIVVLVVMSVVMNRADFLDIPILYVLVNFIGTIAVLKFFHVRNFDKRITGSEKDL